VLNHDDHPSSTRSFRVVRCSLTSTTFSLLLTDPPTPLSFRRRGHQSAELRKNGNNNEPTSGSTTKAAAQHSHYGYVAEPYARRLCTRVAARRERPGTQSVVSLLSSCCFADGRDRKAKASLSLSHSWFPSLRRRAVSYLLPTLALAACAILATHYNTGTPGTGKTSTASLLAVRMCRRCGGSARHFCPKRRSEAYVLFVDCVCVRSFLRWF
jgi:hypothetical protein